MRTVLTGASGFLGKYISKELSKKSFLITLARTGADIEVDLAKQVPNLPSVDLVIHCAGKAHVIPKSDKEIQAFFDVNFNGTKNLLKGLNKSSGLPKSFVLISTVAVYGCESGLMINEEHPLNAQDPYGRSKIQAEILVKEWCLKRKIVCSILRLPLLVGENPPGNLGAMIRGIEKGYYFNIGGGKAKKSMVLAEDVAKLIPLIADIGGVYNLTDGVHPSFAQLSQAISLQLGKNNLINLPQWFAKSIARTGDLLGTMAPINSEKLKKITTDLTFDDAKAKKILKWAPKSVLENIILAKSK